MVLRRFLLAGLGLAILGELSLRYGLGLGDPPLVLRDAEIEYRLVPDKTYKQFGNLIKINRYGMRAPDHPPQAVGQERRVLLIGDSVVYGNHFLDQAETISLQLAPRLESTLGCKVTVMPAAASSWGPVNQAAFLKEVGTLDADLAILIVSGHDLYDTPTFNDNVIPYSTVPAYGAIHHAFQSVQTRLKQRRSPAQALAPVEVGQSETLAALDQILSQLKSDGIGLLLMYHPTVSERLNGQFFAKDPFANWALKSHVTFELIGTDMTAEQYRDDIHPNAGGAIMLATILSERATPHLTQC